MTKRDCLIRHQRKRFAGSRNLYRAPSGRSKGFWRGINRTGNQFELPFFRGRTTNVPSTSVEDHFTVQPADTCSARSLHHHITVVNRRDRRNGQVDARGETQNACFPEAGFSHPSSCIANGRWSRPGRRLGLLNTHGQPKSWLNSYGFLVVAPGESTTTKGTATSAVVPGFIPGRRYLALK